MLSMSLFTKHAFLLERDRISNVLLNVLGRSPKGGKLDQLTAKIWKQPNFETAMAIIEKEKLTEDQLVSELITRGWKKPRKYQKHISSLCERLNSSLSEPMGVILLNSRLNIAAYCGKLLESNSSFKLTDNILHNFSINPDCNCIYNKNHNCHCMDDDSIHYRCNIDALFNAALSDNQTFYVNLHCIIRSVSMTYIYYKDINESFEIIAILSTLLKLDLPNNMLHEAKYCLNEVAKRYGRKIEPTKISDKLMLALSQNDNQLALDALIKLFTFHLNKTTNIKKANLTLEKKSISKNSSIEHSVIVSSPNYKTSNKVIFQVNAKIRTINIRLHKSSTEIDTYLAKKIEHCIKTTNKEIPIFYK